MTNFSRLRWLSRRWRLDEDEWGGGSSRYFWRKKNAIAAAKRSSSTFVSVIDEWDPDCYRKIVWHRDRRREIPPEDRCKNCIGTGIVGIIVQGGAVEQYCRGVVEQYCPKCGGTGRSKEAETKK